MMKKVLAACILIGMFICGTLFAGCDGNNVKAEANDTTHKLESEVEDIEIDFERVTWDSYANVTEYRDTVTGVHYIIYQDSVGYGGMGGITVRYNANGTVFAD